ncbi:uncharacterized protein Z518_02831 [Rhinocladiella mackenziei CBS 650.93]|uniref:Uncharacterized protein n=1 Tax=Rhinocladiella mackenziei CBS 650.93 TaxID=1442369 RepID=A0A0D2JFT9_9EURO|nr:uncharacterized protein Z518_02831 [Rhinocladiella mackenziei CBS 650.93]KIX08175.1 hypothetical protein Z518_02831 [Rhinocladiella mackenziei CBS 650.93]
MGRTTEYTIVGPLTEPPGRYLPSVVKSLPDRKDTQVASPNLRTLYRISAQDSNGSHPEQPSHPSTALPTSPHLPPTPPGASNEDTTPPVDEAASDTAMFRSALVTPINQNSPPTPDDTPPRERNVPYVRPILGTAPSLASTHAESFKTAREDNVSENESDAYSQQYENGFQWPLSSVNEFAPVAHRLRHGALPRSPWVNGDENRPIPRQSPEQVLYQSARANKTHENGVSVYQDKSPTFDASPQDLSARSTPDDQLNEEIVQIHLETVPHDPAENAKLSAPLSKPAGQNGLRRDRSLRDRLLEAQSQDPSASTEKFANIIGWNNSVPIEDDPIDHREAGHEDHRRLSGISTGSTIEAFVFDPNPLPKRKTTLRHVSKHESLRSVSSPLPASNRNSLHSASDSPHRLVHKKARLSNQNRWSFGSEASRSHSLASSAVLPKMEVIRVAVIPERSSSLGSSTSSSSQRQCLSAESGRSHSRKTSDNPPSSWQHKGPFSESLDRGRQPVQAPPAVPPRSSSFSAPTSGTTSRANSITSEHLRVKRQQAEKDLRKTLDRMGSERLVQNLRDWGAEDQVVPMVNGGRKVNQPYGSMGQMSAQTSPLPGTFLSHPADKGEVTNNALGLVVPGTKEWAALRPPSILETPFSQPSFQSASPEINEAKAINYFPHNNHSLQLIEPFPVPESKAVREVQKQQLPQDEVESPLRNPRRPPEPPQFRVIPPTPGDELDQQLGIDGAQVHGRFPGSLRRPMGNRRRSESFISSISRNLSLKNARNLKADQDLDGKLHPFWRPRAFWDDIDNSRPDMEPERSLDRGMVNNSLGLPQERTVVTGPVSLVRRISERRRQKRGIVKQSSHGSLAKLRASRRLHKSPGLGLQFHLIGIRNIQERLVHAKQRKEDEKREKRRADLRRSIGANVISQGDSRFPASNTSLFRDI